MIEPRKLFLIDFVGATISCISLGLILPLIQNVVGIPVNMLYMLGFIALLFAAYSSISFRSFPNNWQRRMRITSLLNVGYGILTIVLILQHKDEVQTLGWIYFALELFVVFALARIELKTSRQHANTE